MKRTTPWTKLSLFTVATLGFSSLAHAEHGGLGLGGSPLQQLLLMQSQQSGGNNSQGGSGGSGSGGGSGGGAQARGVASDEIKQSSEEIRKNIDESFNKYSQAVQKIDTVQKAASESTKSIDSENTADGLKQISAIRDEISHSDDSASSAVTDDIVKASADRASTVQKAAEAMGEAIKISAQTQIAAIQQQQQQTAGGQSQPASSRTPGPTQGEVLSSLKPTTASGSAMSDPLGRSPASAPVPQLSGGTGSSLTSSSVASSSQSSDGGSHSSSSAVQRGIGTNGYNVPPGVKFQ